MGAVNFVHVMTGYDVEEAFNILVAEAEREYGDDIYNGTISTTSLSPVFSLKFDKYRPENGVKAYRLIEKEDFGEKWLSKPIDLGVMHYEVYKKYKNGKVTVKKYTRKPKKVPTGWEYRELHKYMFYGWAAE